MQWRKRKDVLVSTPNGNRADEHQFMATADNFDAMVAKEILRELDAFSGHPGLRLYADNKNILHTMENFKVIIVEDVSLELKGTEQIFRTEIPEATIIGTAQNEAELWKLIRQEVPDLVLLDLGLGGSTTVGVDLCRQLRTRYSQLKILIFTGEVLNERLWVEALAAGADGIILKTGNLLQRDDVQLVMHGRHMVFNEPILEKILVRFRKSVNAETQQTDALLDYDIDEYDERYLRHLALGYTKDMIASLKTMPFGAKSLEKRQAELINRLFPERERQGVNATRLVTRALQLHIIDLENLKADE